MAQLLNVDVPDLPEGYTPLEVVAVVRCLDEKGEVTIAIRSSSGVMAWEAIGMFIAGSDMARADLQSDILTIWEDQDGDGSESGDDSVAED